MSFRTLLEAAAKQPYLVVKDQMGGRLFDVILKDPDQVLGRRSEFDRFGGHKEYHVCRIDLGDTEVSSYQPGEHETGPPSKAQFIELVGELENALCGSEALYDFMVKNVRSYQMGRAATEPRVESLAESAKPGFEPKFDGETSRATHWTMVFDPALPAKLTTYPGTTRTIPWLEPSVVVKLSIDHDYLPRALHDAVAARIAQSLNTDEVIQGAMVRYVKDLAPEPRLESLAESKSVTLSLAPHGERGWYDIVCTSAAAEKPKLVATMFFINTEVTSGGYDQEWNTQKLEIDTLAVDFERALNADAGLSQRILSGLMAQRVPEPKVEPLSESDSPRFRAEFVSSGALNTHFRIIFDGRLPRHRPIEVARLSLDNYLIPDHLRDEFATVTARALTDSGLPPGIVARMVGRSVPEPTVD